MFGFRKKLVPLVFGACLAHHCVQWVGVDDCLPGDPYCNPLSSALIQTPRPGSACESSARIAFQSNRDGDVEVYVMNSDGTEQTRLTAVAGSDQQPSFRPDGSAIVFSTARSGTNELYRMDPDGSNPVNLTNTPADGEFNPTWGPGGKIVYIRTTPNLEVYSMNEDGSGQTNLTNDASNDSNPAISPDGSRIAFTSTRNTGPDADIFVMNIDGSGLTQLTFNGVNEQAPKWNADGTRILFRRFFAGGGLFELIAMNADGSGETRLTNNTFQDGPGEYALAGQGIVYSAEPNGSDNEIFLMYPDGSDIHAIASNPGFDNTSVSYSCD